MTPQLSTYLQEVLGSASTEIRPCPDAGQLPFLLQDVFEFLSTAIAGIPVVLACPKTEQKPSLKNIRAQLSRAEMLLGRPVAYCPDALEPYERRNLIEQKQAFIVPGNQMYLPDLGIDLREYFSKARIKRVEAFNPSTQAFLIWWLLNHPVQQRVRVDDICSPLGYSKMSVTRVVRELVGTGLVESFVKDRFVGLELLQTHEETWQKIQSRFKTPVKNTVWINQQFIDTSMRLAGLSALGMRSMLAPPDEKCYAVSSTDWSRIKGGVPHIPQPAPGHAQLQIWTYRPDIVEKSKLVDTLSLWASLKDDPDDRVQMSLDEMMKELRW